MNSKNLENQLKKSDKSFGNIRNILKGSGMDLKVDNYQRAKEIAIALKTKSGEHYNLAKAMIPSGNGFGMYEDFRDMELKPIDGGTPNQNNVINEIRRLSESDSLPPKDALTMDIFDLLEGSKVEAIATDLQALEYVHNALYENTPIEKIVSNFVDHRNEDGTIEIA